MNKAQVVKNDRKHFRRSQEPMGSDPQQDCRIQAIAYDDSGQPEEKRHIRFWIELKKAQWFSQSSPPPGKPPTGFSESDVGGPPGAICDVGRMMEEPMSSALEATRLTDDKVHHRCNLTMEQALLRHKKPPALDIDGCLERTSTQQSIVFQYTLLERRRNVYRSLMIEAIQAAHSKLSETDGCQINAYRLWLDVGEPYLNFSECDSTAAINSAGPEASRRIGNWNPGFRWAQSVWPIPWDSVMVESVRLVLQRWRGVCSFSQTMRSNRNKEKYQYVFALFTKKRSRPGE